MAPLHSTSHEVFTLQVQYALLTSEVRYPQLLNFLLFTSQCPLGSGTHPIALEEDYIPVKKFSPSFYHFLYSKFHHSGKRIFHHTFQIQTAKWNCCVMLCACPCSVSSLSRSISSWMWSFCFSHSLPLPFLLPSISSQPSQILTVCCTSFFFSMREYRPSFWQQEGSEKSKQRCSSLLPCILLARSSWRQYACTVWVCVCVCVAALQWLRVPQSRDKPQHTAACPAQVSLRADFFQLCRN